MPSTLIIVRSFFSKRVSALSRVALEIASALNKKGHSVEILTDITSGQKNKKHLDFHLPIKSMQNFGIFKTYREFLKYFKINNFQNLFLHTSLIGLIFFSIANFRNFNQLKNITILIYNYKPQINDFKQIRPKEYLLYWKRIFLRNFFYGAFVPKFILRFLLKKFKHIYTPSERLTRIYSNYTKNVSTLNYGINNKLGSVKTSEENKLLDDIKAYKKSGTTVMVHAGLATPFRGWKYATSLVSNINNQNIILYLLLYADSDEGISEIDINLAKKIAKNSNNKIILVTEPVINIDKILSYVDIAIYQYRYIGDIPECPLTINELQNQGVIVFSNRLGGLSDMIPSEIPILSGDMNQDLKTLCAIINDLVSFKVLLKNNVEPYSWPDAAQKYLDDLTAK